MHFLEKDKLRRAAQCGYVSRETMGLRILMKSKFMEPGFNGDPLVEVVLRDHPVGNGKRSLRAVIRQDIVERLYAEGKIERSAFDAARKFQADGELLEPFSHSSSDFMIGGHRTTFEPSDAALMAAKRHSEARARLRQALRAVGPGADAFAMAVLLHRPMRMTLKEACIAQGWQKDSGGAVLALILYQLARHYGFAGD